MNTQTQISPAKKSGIIKFLQMRELVLIAVILLGGIVMSIVTPIFFSEANILAILLGLSIQSIIAVGMVILLVSGSFDLSVGSVVAFAGVIACMSLKAGIPVPVAVIIGVLSGSFIGLVNGLIVAKWNINSFIVTLGMSSIVRGFVLILANGVTIIQLPDAFTILGKGKLLGIQFPIVLTVIILVIGDILLRRSSFLRQNYYIGGNEKAAAMTGIKVKRIKIFNFVLVGTLAAFAGVITAARLASASVNIGQGLEMQVITACVIGGASLNGGEGTVFGAFLGTLLMAALINALNLIGVDVYWQNVLNGVILIGAVVLDTVLKKKREESM